MRSFHRGGALPSESRDLAVEVGFNDWRGNDWRPPEGLSPMERQRAWGRSFNVVYHAGIAAIITAGRILIEAKAEIPRGEWTPWLEEQTPISERTAQVLMKIAGDANILRYSANPNRDSVLPDDKVVLAGLCGIETHRFDSLVQAGKIHPEMRRGDIKGALADQRHMDAPPALESLPEGKYRAILADPPWPWDARGNGGHDRSGEAHYPTMTLGEIMALDVASAAAEDCLLFLWVPAQNFRDADGVMASWGFELVSTAFVWVKDGAPGLGYWTRKGAEICLLGKRGAPKRLDAGVAEVVHAPRGAHSEKPGEVRERIRRLVAGPYLELFAREVDDGWDVWGNHPGLGEEG